MSKKQKLLDKLADPGATVTWSELCSLLRSHGFEILNGGGGSGRKFYHRDKDVLLCLHEPHPGNELKRYMKADALEALEKIGVVP